MDCLYNFVGLLGCGNEEPLSGLYINDYAGMSGELLEKISTPEQASYFGFWQSVQRVAYARFKRDVQTMLYTQAQVRLDQVLFQTSKEFVQDWQQIQVLPADTTFRGIFATVSGSKYLAIKIKQIYAYNAGSNPVSGVDVKIFQTQDGKVLWSGQVDLEVGMNYIPVNETFYSDFDKVNLLVVVDCSNLDTTKGTFVDFGWAQMNGDCATRWSNFYTEGWQIYPASAPLDYGLGKNWTQSYDQSGIYMDAQIMCSIDSFICAQADFLADAWANLLCYQILYAKMASPRANYFAQGNREYTERTMVTFLDNYNDAMAVWARQLNLRGEGLCFDCGAAGMIQQGSVRP